MLRGQPKHNTEMPENHLHSLGPHIYLCPWDRGREADGGMSKKRGPWLYPPQKREHTRPRITAGILSQTKLHGTWWAVPAVLTKFCLQSSVARYFLSGMSKRAMSGRELDVTLPPQHSLLWGADIKAPTQFQSSEPCPSSGTTHLSTRWWKHILTRSNTIFIQRLPLPLFLGLKELLLLPLILRNYVPKPFSNYLMPAGFQRRISRTEAYAAMFLFSFKTIPL